MPAEGWVDRLLPRPLRPYAKLMRLDRPIGTWLLLWPGWWSLAWALDRAPAGFGEWLHLAWLYLLFGFGAVVMRGAGCTYNDIVDRNFDARVERTRTRPIPSGQVSVRAAIVFIFVQLFAGLAVLLQFNGFAMIVGAASLVLVFTYPLMKRITYWPQVVLGLAFNWGALLGWAAVTGSLGIVPLVVYLGGIFWTLGYDTIYAIQDLEDDALAGVKSSARRLGDKAQRAVAGFYLVTVAAAFVAGAAGGLGLPYDLALFAFAIHLGLQARRVKTTDPALALRLFRSNTWAGAILFLALALGAFR
ncbi:MAG: 4-hydroxybenzoate octaprenyltransferase [Phenylobacterium sp.]|nr:4-hydroxybenzoate octaprenyltransferase [Phenylobacterium sp.]